MIGYIYKKCFSVLGNKPIRLWGLSLLSAMMSSFAVMFGMLPIISVPITLTISAGMALVYLDGYRGIEVDSDQIFMGFKQFARVAGGMAWMGLWMIIWSMVPVYGIIKSYSYRFTPYILMTKPELSAGDALRESMKETNGLKGKMFLADLLLGVCFSLVTGIAGLISRIPVVGMVIAAIFVIIVVMALPLFNGLLKAAFYAERSNAPQAQQATAVCPNCGNAIVKGSKFCKFCGASTVFTPQQGYQAPVQQQGYQPPVQQQGYQAPVQQQGYQAPVQQQSYQPPVQQPGYQAPQAQPQQTYQPPSGNDGNSAQ